VKRPESGSPDIALSDLVARVEAVVAQGAGPDDEMLRQVFEDLRVAVQNDERLRPELAERLRRIDRIPLVVADQLPTHGLSRIPGGRHAHRLIHRATRRRDNALLEQIRELAHEVKNVMFETDEALFRAIPQTSDRLAGDVEALTDALVRLETRTSQVIGRLEDLERRVDRLDEAESARSFNPWFAARDFDEEFRGSRNQILDRYHDLADVLAATGGPVVDLGCGRGELIELLVTRGVEAWGAELSEELVELCRSISLDVRLLDAHSALKSLDDASIGGAALIQVVEHLTPQQLVDLIPLLFRKIRPGGVVVAETVNATSPYALTHSFYLDPTHHNPIHPAYLGFLFRHGGFSKVEIEPRSFVPEADQLEYLKSGTEPDDLVDPINRSLHTLNETIFVAQDYAVIATR
jgi:SAM-dependent methyltransferase